MTRRSVELFAGLPVHRAVDDTITGREREVQRLVLRSREPPGSPASRSVRPMDVMKSIEDERLGLVGFLRGLRADDWERPSLCGGWTVRQVLGHLVTPFTTSSGQMIMAVARARGVDRAMDRKARELAAGPPADLLTLLEQHAGTRFRPPGLPFEAPLVDVVVHGADIRWALGEDRQDWGDPTRLRPALDFLISRRARIGLLQSGMLRGIRLVADDQDWSGGDGSEVVGTSLALAVGVFGRPDALALLAGDGVQVLAAAVKA